MKKTIVFAATLALGVAASSQSLNVSSAYEAYNRGYLKKAVGYLDKAQVHEQTKEDAQTWYISTLVYCQIGDEIMKGTKKGKELATLVPNWSTKAYTALLNWKQFDTKGEYTSKVTPFFQYVSNEYYNRAVNEVNTTSRTPDYNVAMMLCDTSVQLGNIVGDKDLAATASLLAGRCAKALNKTDAMKEYFLPLTKGKAKKGIDVDFVYQTMFQTYVAENDTNNAFRIARNYQKNYPEDYKADALLASAYMMKGNVEEGVKTVNAAVEKCADDPAKKAEALCVAAAVYETAKDYTGAEAKYKEALAINPAAYAANAGLASMNYNRAVDKITEAGNVPLDDQTGLYDKLTNESKELFKVSIPNFIAAINYIDGLPENQKQTMRQALYSNLKALNTAYARLDQLSDAKMIEARIKELEESK